MTWNIRSISPADYSDVCRLINEERLFGEPCIAEQDLAAAIVPGKDFFWESLGKIETVVIEREGAIRGAASAGTLHDDHTKFLLWLHAGEEKTLIEKLVCALQETQQLSYAFWVAALFSCLEGLPSSRSVTREVLENYGLLSLPGGQYLVLETEKYALSSRKKKKSFPRVSEKEGEITLTTPFGKVICNKKGTAGIISWIHVEEAHRGKGKGRELLESALDFLLPTSREIILYVDDMNERTAALHLYQSVGFQQHARFLHFKRPEVSLSPVRFALGKGLASAFRFLPW